MMKIKLYGEIAPAPEAGDLFRIQASGPVAWANSNLTYPPAQWFHYGLIAFHRGDDWVTIDSTPDGFGVRVGLLSWHKRPISLLRVNAPAEIRHRTPMALVTWGRSHYDYLLIPKLVLGGLSAWTRILLKEQCIRRLRAEEFPYAKNNALICTEAVQVAYLAMGFPIIDPEVVPIPSAFEQAILDGVLSKIGLVW